MTPADLVQVGKALYGERWQTPMARDLGISYQTVRLWLSGRGRVNADVGKLVELICAKNRELDAALITIAGE